MTNLCRCGVFVLLLWLSSASLALEASGHGHFEKLIRGTDKGVTITRATLADRVSYKFVVVALPGEYPFMMTIYDGQGREVFRALATLTVREALVGRSISYEYDKSKDAPGTWWYVVTLNDKVVLSASIDVEP
jgi:hypothetical protein